MRAGASEGRVGSVACAASGERERGDGTGPEGGGARWLCEGEGHDAIMRTS